MGFEAYLIGLLLSALLRKDLAMANATHPALRQPVVEWTVLPAESLPVTVTSLSEMEAWFASHPEVDPATVPMWRKGRRLNGLVPHPTLW